MAQANFDAAVPEKLAELAAAAASSAVADGREHATSYVEQGIRAMHAYTTGGDGWGGLMILVALLALFAIAIALYNAAYELPVWAGSAMRITKWPLIIFLGGMFFVACIAWLKYA
jgi:hypothetical protein